MSSSNNFNNDDQADASRVTAHSRRCFSLLSDEDKRTYHKWKHATLIVYGSVAVMMVMLALALSPTDRISPEGEMYSSLASPSGKSP
jgi:hypothetical protein